MLLSRPYVVFVVPPVSGRVMGNGSDRVLAIW